MVHSPHVEPSEERGMELEELFASCTSQEMKLDLRGMPRDLREMGHSPPFAFHSLRGTPHEECFLSLKGYVESHRARLASLSERGLTSRSPIAILCTSIPFCLEDRARCDAAAARLKEFCGSRGSAVAEGVEPAARDSGWAAVLWQTLPARAKSMRRWGKG
jgi:hypothetical protein